MNHRLRDAVQCGRFAFGAIAVKQIPEELLLLRGQLGKRCTELFQHEPQYDLFFHGCIRRGQIRQPAVFIVYKTRSTGVLFPTQLTGDFIRRTPCRCFHIQPDGSGVVFSCGLAFLSPLSNLVGMKKATRKADGSAYKKPKH